MAKEAQQVEVTRTLLPSPTVDNPERMVYQIEYRVGTLPPHFVYCEKSEWNEKKEKELIQADIKKRLEAPKTIVTL
jgi:hypothetical protein